MKHKKINTFFAILLLMSSLLANTTEKPQDSKGFGQKIPEAALTKITLELHQVPPGEALAAISKEADLKLNYNLNRLPAEQKISLKVKDEPALQVLLNLANDIGSKVVFMGDEQLLLLPSTSIYGKIQGVIRDAETQAPLVGVNVIVRGTVTGAATDPQGQYLIPKLSPGLYSIMVSMLGYKTQRIENIVILKDTLLTIDIKLEPQAVLLNEVIVTPGQFAIMGSGPVVKQALTREDLEIAPFGEDAYRAVTRLPGVSAGDFSAKFTVRGGENDEILLLLDGMELYEPFHMKEIDGGALSIIEVATVDGIDLLTGGFPAEFGDRMSGVFNVRTRKAPAGTQRTSMGLSLMNARIISDGTFGDNRGSWLFSARRGYLDLVMRLMNEEDPPLPVYYDIMSKIDYRFKSGNTLSAHFLHSGDRLEYVEDDNDEDKTGYDNTYGWLKYNHILSQRLFLQTLASYSRLRHERLGTGYHEGSELVKFNVSDQNSVDIYGLKQEWNFDISDSWYLKSGFDMKYFRTRYDYQNIRQRPSSGPDRSSAPTDTIDTFLKPAGTKFGVFVSNRFQPFSPLTTEIGLRYDHNSAVGDNLVSPRVSIAYALAEQTFLRAGWGYYYQGHAIHNINVNDGETGFQPAELSKHYVGGLEHTFRNGLNIRLEGYYKGLSRLHSAYRNFTNTIEVFPEVQDDRYKLNFNGATSKGIEAYLKYDRGGKLTWWASYALAYLNEDVNSLVFEGKEYSVDKEFPGRYDQRHSIHLDVNYRPNRKWHVNMTWQYHSGWPYTDSFLTFYEAADGSIQYSQAYGEYNGSDYPAYHRLDLTVNRHFYTSRGRISAFLSIINVYNHRNVRNTRYYQEWDYINERPYLDPVKENWFKLLPSVGISWNF